MPVPGVTIIVGFFPNEVEADLSLRLIQFDREAEELRVPAGLRIRMRRDILLSYRNLIQALSPVKTGRLRRSIRVRHAEGAVSTIVGYAPVVERRKRFFEAGAAIASVFDRVIFERYRMEALELRLRGADLSGVEGGKEQYTELKRNLSVARSAVSRRTTGRIPSKTQAFGVGPQLELNRISNIAQGLTGATRTNFIADQLVQHAGSLGPSGTQAPAVGRTRIREFGDLRSFGREMRVVHPTISTFASGLLGSLQAIARDTRRYKPVPNTRDTARKQIQIQRQELDFQRGRSTSRAFPQAGSPFERSLNQQTKAATAAVAPKSKARKARKGKR